MPFFFWFAQSRLVHLISLTFGYLFVVGSLGFTRRLSTYKLIYYGYSFQRALEPLVAINVRCTTVSRAFGSAPGFVFLKRCSIRLQINRHKRNNSCQSYCARFAAEHKQRHKSLSAFFEFKLVLGCCSLK